MTLERLSDEGAVVWRDAPEGETSGDGVRSLDAQVLTGALGGDLVRRPLLSTSREESQPQFGTIRGSTMPWFVDRQVGDTTVTDLHRFDVATGTDVVDGSVPWASTADYSGTSWFVVPYVGHDESAEPSGRIEGYPLSSAPGRPDTAWTGHSTLLTLAAGKAVGSIDVDENSLAMITYGDLWDVDPPDFTQTVELVDLTSGTRRQLASMNGLFEGIGGVELGRTRVVWNGASGNLGWSIYSVARTGGKVKGNYGSGYPGNEHWRTPATVTDDGKAGWIYDLATMMTTDPGTAVEVADGDSTYDLPVPGNSNGLVGDGEHFYTAIGGSSATAGVYRLDGTKAGDARRTRVAKVPAAHRALRGWTFKNGVVTWADHSGGNSGQLRLWRRPIRLGSGGPALEPEQKTSIVAGTPSKALSSRAFAADNQRALVARPGGAWLLTGWSAADDRTIVPSKIKGLDGKLYPPRNVQPQLTPHWALLAGQVFATSNQRKVFSEPAAGRRAAQDAMDGDTLLYGTATTATPGKPGRGEVWMVNLKHPDRRTKLASYPCGHAPQVAVFRSTVAWSSCHQASVTVHTLGPGAEQSFTTGYRSPGDTDGIDLTLDKGVLGWVAGQKAAVADLTQPDAEPVALAGPTRKMLLSNGLLARETPRDDPWAPWGLQVERSPIAPGS